MEVGAEECVAVRRNRINRRQAAQHTSAAAWHALSCMTAGGWAAGRLTHTRYYQAHLPSRLPAACCFAARHRRVLGGMLKSCLGGKLCLNVIAWPAAMRRAGKSRCRWGRLCGGVPWWLRKGCPLPAAARLAALQLMLQLVVHTAGWQAGWLVLHSAAADRHASSLTHGPAAADRRLTFDCGSGLCGSIQGLCEAQGIQIH